MKKYFFLFVLILSFNKINAQLTGTELVKELNRFITLFSADNASMLTFFAQTGTLEQRQNVANTQRIKLSDIGGIQVEASAIGFTVNIKCAEGTQCINLVKNDTISSYMPSNAFFFTEAKAANTFAKRFEELIAKYPSEHKAVKAELLHGADGQIPMYIIEAPKNIAVNKQAVRKEKEEDDADEEETDKTAVKPKRVVVTPEERERMAMEKKQERIDQLEEAKAERTPRQQVVSNDANAAEDIPEPVCKQLTAIIKAGRNSRFKEIEGQEKNAEKKINFSKLKLRGAKSNYLSWYKNERAFIAEYKTSADREIILIEFEKIQTELEDCLEGAWEDTDHSTDAMYANVNEDVKDVEYKFTSDPLMPTLRIMINTDASGKHTLFIRIR